MIEGEHSFPCLVYPNRIMMLYRLFLKQKKNSGTFK